MKAISPLRWQELHKIKDEDGKNISPAEKIIIVNDFAAEIEAKEGRKSVLRLADTNDEGKVDFAQ